MPAAAASFTLCSSATFDIFSRILACRVIEGKARPLLAAARHLPACHVVAAPRGSTPHRERCADASHHTAHTRTTHIAFTQQLRYLSNKEITITDQRHAILTQIGTFQSKILLLIDKIYGYFFKCFYSAINLSCVWYLVVEKTLWKE